MNWNNNLAELIAPSLKLFHPTIML